MRKKINSVKDIQQNEPGENILNLSDEFLGKKYQLYKIIVDGLI